MFFVRATGLARRLIYKFNQAMAILQEKNTP